MGCTRAYIPSKYVENQAVSGVADDFTGHCLFPRTPIPISSAASAVAPCLSSELLRPVQPLLLDIPPSGGLPRTVFLPENQFISSKTITSVVFIA